MSDTAMIPNDAEANEPQTIVIDGSRYDAETGEFLGFADRAAFVVQSREDAEWVLSKMLAAEAALAALDSTPEAIAARAILANADRLRKEQQDRLDSLHRRFDADLADLARRELEGQRGRTLKTLFGTISLRTQKGGLKVADADKALALAKDRGWEDAIKRTESFRVTGLTEEQRRALVAEWQADPFATDMDGFAVEPDRETVAIKTGVQG